MAIKTNHSTGTMRGMVPLILMLIVCAELLGQQEIPRVKIPIGQIGHINTLAFSGDGKLMASGSADNSVIIWNAYTGTDIRKLNTGEPVKKIFFSPDGSYIITISGQPGAEITGKKTLMKWDTRTGALLGKHFFSGSEYVGFLPAMNTFILTQDSDQMQKIQEKVRTMDMNKFLSDTAEEEEEEDSKEVPVTDVEGDKLLKDLADEKITPEEYLKKYKENLKKNMYNPYQKVNVLLDAGSLLKSTKLEKNFDELYSIRYNGKEYLLGSMMNMLPEPGESRYTLEAWEAKDLVPGSPSGAAAKPFMIYPVEAHSTPIYISPAKGLFALVINKRNQRHFELYNLKSPAPFAKLEYAGSQLNRIEFSGSGDKIFAYSSTFDGSKPKYFVEGWNTTTFEREIFFNLHEKYFTGLVSVSPFEDRFATVSAYPSWQIINVNKAGDSTGRFGGRSSAPSYFGFEAGDNKIYTNYYGQPEMQEFMTVVTTAMIENEAFNKGVKLTTEERDRQVKERLGPVNFSGRPDGYNLTWDLERGGARRTVASRFSGTHRVTSSDNNYSLQNDTYETGNAPPNLSYIQMMRTPEKGLSPGIAAKMREYYDTSNQVYKYIYAGNKNGPVTKLINRKSKDTLSLIKIDSTDWVMVLQNGYYMASRDGAKILNYVSGYSVYPFDQFDLQFNRPDKVLKAMGKADPAMIEAYRKAWLKRIKRANVDTAQFGGQLEVPVADISNREQIMYEQSKGKLVLEIRAIDAKRKLDRYNIWVNDVPAFGKNGKSLRHLNVTEFNTSAEIDLSEGVNRIEVSVLNNAGTESYRVPVLVNYKPSTKPKSTVYFIGIGIDQFADAKYNLQYSRKDIRDIARKLQERYNGNIVVDTLFNEQVTFANVKALKEKLKRTSINDKVIVSYSGHGLLNKEFEYFLSTYEVNFDKPEDKGLPYDELENLLDSIPARRKLMFIDACHSGEVDKEDLVVLDKAPDVLIKGLKPIAYKQAGQLGLKNSFELMQSLFVNVGKSTGATIISAAAGTQFALERNDLKNGVFTYSILQILNKQQSIKISELKRTVSASVEELTRGQQQPTSRNETIAVDWEL